MHQLIASKHQFQSLCAIPVTFVYPVSLPPDSDVSMQAAHVSTCTHSLFLYVRSIPYQRCQSVKLKKPESGQEN